jgi:hypothetical protein
MKYKRTRTGITRQDLARTSHTLAGAGSVLAAPTGFRALPIHPGLAAARKTVATAMPVAIIPRQREKSGLAQDRAFWRDLLARRASLGGLPAHSAGGYRHRRFAIIRDAAWITLYRAAFPFPQVGVFLRCVGLAGEAFFTLADRASPEIQPLLRAELGPDLAMEWGACHHPGMTDIAAILAAPLPWDDNAAEQHIAWMLRVGAAWWNCFASLAGGPEVNNASPAKRGRHARAKAGLGGRSG